MSNSAAKAKTDAILGDPDWTGFLDWIVCAVADKVEQENDMNTKRNQKHEDIFDDKAQPGGVPGSRTTVQAGGSPPPVR